jgi:hypothetical protein
MWVVHLAAVAGGNPNGITFNLRGAIKMKYADHNKGAREEAEKGFHSLNSRANLGNLVSHRIEIPLVILRQDKISNGFVKW